MECRNDVGREIRKLSCVAGFVDELRLEADGAEPSCPILINRREYLIPGNPVVTRSSLQRRKFETSQLASSIVSNRDVLYVTSGRAALALILKNINLPFGSKVLIPAYHCPSMVLPLVAHGAVPIFYNVNSNLSPNIEDLTAKATTDVKCLVVVHYFGFPQNLDMLTEFSRARSLIMIEDCAHAYFGTYKGEYLGSYADYAICSPWKFLPIVDGGCAILNSNGIVDIPLESGGIKFQIKIFVNLVENTLNAGKFGRASRLMAVLFWFKDKLLTIIKQLRIVDTSDSGPLSAYGGSDFEEEWSHVRMSIASKWILRHVSLGRVVKKRRANYKVMASELEKCDGCKVLYPLLPDNVVPYVLPVIFTDGDAVYHKLRDMNIQVYRWDSIPPGVCDVSAEYSTCLVQVPIHQELTEDDLNYVIGVIRQALGEASAPEIETERRSGVF